MNRGQTRDCSDVTRWNTINYDSVSCHTHENLLNRTLLMAAHKLNHFAFRDGAAEDSSDCNGSAMRVNFNGGYAHEKRRGRVHLCHSNSRWTVDVARPDFALPVRLRLQRIRKMLAEHVQDWLRQGCFLA